MVPRLGPRRTRSLDEPEHAARGPGPSRRAGAPPSSSLRCPPLPDGRFVLGGEEVPRLPL